MRRASVRPDSDRDDGAHAWDGAPQGLLESQADGGQLGRAAGTGSLELNPDVAVFVDVEQLDVAAIGDERRAEPVEGRLDGLPETMCARPLHALRIGGPDRRIELLAPHIEPSGAPEYDRDVIKVTVRLFGSLREQAGTSQLDVDLAEGARVCDLRALLADRHPQLRTLGERVATSVNFELSNGEARLRDGDEVALLPPVAGGAGRAGLCTLSEEPLDEQEVIARVAASDAGGVVSFVGVVRDQARGRSIRHLEYEAYPPMAEREMEKIAAQAGASWPGTRVAIAHRTGRLEIGDAAVVVVAASAHRAEAFEACRFAIDTLKQTVPIWKKEVATDGEYWVDDHP